MGPDEGASQAEYLDTSAIAPQPYWHVPMSVRIAMVLLLLAPASVQARALTWCSAMGIMGSSCCGGGSGERTTRDEAQDQHQGAELASAPCCMLEDAPQRQSLPPVQLQALVDAASDTAMAITFVPAPAPPTEQQARFIAAPRGPPDREPPRLFVRLQSFLI